MSQKPIGIREASGSSPLSPIPLSPPISLPSLSAPYPIFLYPPPPPPPPSLVFSYWPCTYSTLTSTGEPFNKLPVDLYCDIGKSWNLMYVLLRCRSLGNGVVVPWSYPKTEIHAITKSKEKKRERERNRKERKTTGKRKHTRK